MPVSGAIAQIVAGLLETACLLFAQRYFQIYLTLNTLTMIKHTNVVGRSK